MTVVCAKHDNVIVLCLYASMVLYFVCVVACKCHVLTGGYLYVLCVCVHACVLRVREECVLVHLCNVRKNLVWQ